MTLGCLIRTHIVSVRVFILRCFFFFAIQDHNWLFSRAPLFSRGPRRAAPGIHPPLILRAPSLSVCIELGIFLHHRLLPGLLEVRGRMARARYGYRPEGGGGGGGGGGGLLSLIMFY